jgi:hypothetical protein
LSPYCRKPRVLRFLACIGLAGIALLISCENPAGSPQEDESRGSHPVFAGINGVWHPPGADVYKVSLPGDDGTEADGSWYGAGYSPGQNYVGDDGEVTRYAAAVRFNLPDMPPGNGIAYARLRLAASSRSRKLALTIRITGGVEPDPRILSSANLPSQLERTDAAVTWHIKNWSPTTLTNPSYLSSPDLAGIVNEVISRPGSDSDRTLTLILEPTGPASARPNFVCFLDHSGPEGTRHPAVLEIYPTIESAFLGGPMLGRPTATSVTINVINLAEIDVLAEYGTTPGTYTHATEPLTTQQALDPIEIKIGGLEPDTRYHYRLRYRRAGEEEYVCGKEYAFHTQRVKGRPFRFTIQADSHILPGLEAGDPRRLRLYDRTLLNASADQPDFHISMGDFAHIEFYAGRSARTLLEATDRYLFQRQFLANICHSAPFYLVLGNHEGEQGWRLARDSDSIEVWGTLARKVVIPNPYPDDFYAGNEDLTECCGLREDYYAWQWGDALFVVLDPFWYTARRPHRTGGGYEPSYDGWDWTVGKDQYEWLYHTLHGSVARWKFVFSHHMTGGCLGGRQGNSPYGRGGKDAAKFKVAGRPSFEWGGEDSLGNYIFDAKRPGWEQGPIHDLLVREGVNIFFRGHDHAFIYEELDGLVYQTCPQPADITYSSGEYRQDFFESGLPSRNSGHIRVSVCADSVRVDYVRSVLPENEPLREDGAEVRNGTVSYSYTLSR